VLVAVLLAVGGIAVFAGTRGDAPARERVAVVPTAPEAPAPVPVVAAPEPAAVQEITAAPEITVAPEIAAAPRAPTGGARSKPRAASPSEPRDDFAAELALLKRAKSAQVAGDRTDALALVREQARRFPRGAFVEERRALEAILLCELGKRERGRAAAAAFTSEFQASPLTERVRRACD
jgi:hypothetical protein